MIFLLREEAQHDEKKADCVEAGVLENKRFRVDCRGNNCGAGAARIWWNGVLRTGPSSRIGLVSSKAFAAQYHPYQRR